MKTIKRNLIFFFLLTILACNHQAGKSKKDHTDNVEKNKIDQSITTKTDKTKAIKPVRPEQKESKLYDSVATAILTTSPRYIELTKGLTKAVVKNGGSYFGLSLEDSPNPIADKAGCYSETYDYTVYEIYPDRRLNTARFSFDPNKNQLYEYNTVNDQLLPIAFDSSLLKLWKRKN
jgi:hypothetical protein